MEQQYNHLHLTFVLIVVIVCCTCIGVPLRVTIATEYNDLVSLEPSSNISMLEFWCCHINTIYCKLFEVGKFCSCKTQTNSLENIHGWTVVLYSQSLLHRLFYWKSFAITDRFVKTTKLFHLKQFAIHGNQSIINVYLQLCSYLQLMNTWLMCIIHPHVEKLSGCIGQNDLLQDYFIHIKDTTESLTYCGSISIKWYNHHISARCAPVNTESDSAL